MLLGTLTLLGCRISISLLSNRSSLRKRWEDNLVTIEEVDDFIEVLALKPSPFIFEDKERNIKVYHGKCSEKNIGYLRKCPRQ